jgi:hypothetical protein
MSCIGSSFYLQEHLLHSQRASGGSNKAEDSNIGLAWVCDPGPHLSCFLFTEKQNTTGSRGLKIYRYSHYIIFAM